MRECIFIFKRHTCFQIALLLLLEFVSAKSFAATNTAGSAHATEDDHRPTPYTQYGELHEDNEEAESTRYFQYGRFFGLSVGAGYQMATGNRGKIWQNSPPMLAFRLHYWFDFNYALDLGLSTAKFYFDKRSITSPQHFDFNLISYAVNLKYYFDTTNISSTLSFANPHLIAGYDLTQKTTAITPETADPVRKFASGIALGAGLEFPLQHKRTYITVEGKYNLLNWDDANNSSELLKDTEVTDLSGNTLYGLVSLMFTW